MEAFFSRNSHVRDAKEGSQAYSNDKTFPSLEDDDASTEVKLAILHSLHPDVDQSTLLDLLVTTNGSVETASSVLALKDGTIQSPRKRSATAIGYQTSLAAFRKPSYSDVSKVKKRRTLTKKGQTLHLYSPEDVEQHTPCSIIHNFLPPKDAEALLKELLEEAPSFERASFKIFDNVVQSPHTACFYVATVEEENRQKKEYLYNGSYLDVRDPSPFPVPITDIVRMYGKLLHRCARLHPRSRTLSTRRSQGE